MKCSDPMKLEENEHTMKPFCPSNPLGLIVDAAYRKHPVRRAVERHLAVIRALSVALPILAGVYFCVQCVPPDGWSPKVVLGTPALVLASVLVLWVFVNEFRSVAADDETLKLIANDPGIATEHKVSYASHLRVYDGILLPSIRRWAWDVHEEACLSSSESPGRAMLFSYLERSSAANEQVAQ